MTLVSRNMNGRLSKSLTSVRAKLILLSKHFEPYFHKKLAVVRYKIIQAQKPVLSPSVKVDSSVNLYLTEGNKRFELLYDAD